MSSIIEVKNLSFAYNQETILNDLSFDVTSGQFLTIAGPNGAGKTTLLNLICGILNPTGGFVKIDGCDVKSYSIKKLAQKAAVVRQEFVPPFDFTVEETVMMARAPYLGAFGFESKADEEIAALALEMTETIRFARRPLAHLSGGERQRVFIARALAQNTPILLLDEPTSFLDMKHQTGIYDLLKKLQLEKGKTIVAVTHDINLAAQYCDKVLLLGADNYHIGKPGDVFTTELLEKTFGVRIFAVNFGQEKFFIPSGKLAKPAGPNRTTAFPPDS